MTAPGSASAHLPMPVRVAGTAAVVPGRRWTTAELVEELGGGRDASEVEARSGIAARHLAEPGDSAADLGARALRAALADARLPAEALQRIMFVDSTRGDVLIPATANRIAAALGLGGTCDCFDLSNACMSFLTAFDLAARCVVTGCRPVAIVAVEMPSRYITREDARPFLVFGDGAAAVVVDGGNDDGEAIVGCYLRNNGLLADDTGLAHPGVSGKPETIRFPMPNRRMGEIALQMIRESTDAVLSQSGLTLADVQWFLPHQPNGSLLQAIITELRLDARRVVPVVQELGSLGAVSIPTSLDRLRRTRQVRPGDRILMVGVGAGLSTGAILLQTGAAEGA
jgi:3-oxoacyl-(acyl-carrier-protein) synthase III